MSKYLRREAAKQCPVHQMVFDESSTRLADFGVFQKGEVLEHLNLTAMADAIRWDYIREFIQEEQSCELVPLALRYFRRHKEQEEHVNPGAFIAGGNGKKTAGYAAVIPRNDHLVIHRIAQRRHMANGVGKAFQNYRAAVEAKMLANTPSVGSAAPLQLGAVNPE